MNKRTIVLTLATILAASLATLMGCASTPHKTNKEEAQARWEQMRARVKFQLAEQNYDSGRLEEALRLCREVLALHPTHLDGYLLMARIQLEKGQVSEAQSALDTASGLEQPSPETAYLRGLLAERREEPVDAADWYKRAYEDRPNEPEYLLAYTESLLVLGELEPAFNVLGLRRHDFQKNVRVQLLTAQTLSMLGRVHEATDVYLSVLRLEPNEPLLREEAGLALLADGRLDEAQAALNPLLESPQNKPSATVLQVWGRALLEAHDAKRAASVLAAGTVRYPQAFALWLLLGKAQLIEEEPTAARHSAQQACRLAPDSAEARLLLAYCCLATGDREGAAAAAQRIIAVKPDDAEALTILERAIQPATRTRQASAVQ